MEERGRGLEASSSSFVSQKGRRREGPCDLGERVRSTSPPAKPGALSVAQRSGAKFQRRAMLRNRSCGNVEVGRRVEMGGKHKGR